MVFNKLKSNHTLNFFLFPLLGILFWLRGLISPAGYPASQGEFGNILFAPLYNWLQDYMLPANLVSLFLFLLMGTIILQINSRYDFIRIRTMIPGTLFIILAGGFTGLHMLHPVYFGGVFLLFALYRLCSACDKARPYSAAFDSGFFLGVAVLFYLNLFALLPAFIIGIGVLSRESGWKEFLLNLIGFIVPLIFGISYAFYTDAIPYWLEFVETSVLTPVDHISDNLFLKGYIGILLLYTVLGSIKMIKDYDTKKVSTRKYFTVFLLIFLCAVAAVLLIPSASVEMLLIAVVPLTFLISNFFMFLKSRFWGELLFIFLFGVVVILQIIP